MKDCEFWVIWVILVFLGCMVYALFAPETPPLPQCPDTEIVCYRYYTDGGLLGGVTARKVSCNKDWDYYMNITIGYPDGCTRVYEKYYD